MEWEDEGGSNYTEVITAMVSIKSSRPETVCDSN